jgi:hypothetical protein
MGLYQAMVTLGTTPVLIGADRKSISMTNTHASNTVYLGNLNVTSSSYGVRLTAGSSITLNAVEGDLYAVASGGSTVLSILNHM